MTRTEFIEILQRTLAGSLSSSSVGENIRYYQEYIDTQIRLGQSEQEVIEGLGDPRLLAKTIIEAGKFEGKSAGSYDEVYEDGGTEADEKNGKSVYRIPGWLFLVLVLLAVIVIVGAAFSLLSALLPFLIPILFAVMIIRLIQRRN